MIKKRCALVVIVVAMLFGVAHAIENAPEFDDYKVKSISNLSLSKINFKGNKEARLYRTNLNELLGKKPNFAGHYILTDWGCGSNCSQYAAVDVNSGNVYLAPFTVQACADFKVGSTLFIRNSCESRLFPKMYYIWKDNNFEEISPRFDLQQQ